METNCFVFELQEDTRNDFQRNCIKIGQFDQELNKWKVKKAINE